MTEGIGTYRARVQAESPDAAPRPPGTAPREWHPRNPDLYVYGEPRMRPEQGGDEGDQDGGDVGGLARAAMIAGMGGGVSLNAIEVVRVMSKYREALNAGRFDPTLGRLGRLPTALGLTVQMRVDNRIVDPLAPRIASAASLGRSFTRFDQLAMRTSVLLGASLAAIQIGSAIPNIVDAVGKDGPWNQNLLSTTAGRFGVLQLAGGVMGASLFATALRQTAGSVPKGGGAIARILAAGNAPIMAKPLWGRIGIASGLLIAANAIGYLDPLNTGETRSTGEALADAVHKTPVISDPKLRTGAIIAAGGVTAYKASAAIRAAGLGAAGLPKGYLAAGAAIGGLLGAQLLGGLRALDA